MSNEERAWGGRRPGAGRPTGSIRRETKLIRVDKDVSEWLKEWSRRNHSDIVEVQAGKLEIVFRKVSS